MKTLKSLANMVERCDDEFLIFELEYEQVLCLLLYVGMLDSVFGELKTLIFFNFNFAGADSGSPGKDCQNSYC